MPVAKKISVPTFIKPVVFALDDADAGQLFKQILAYDNGGDATELSLAADLIFQRVKEFLDKDRQRRENGAHGGRKPELTGKNRKEPGLTGQKAEIVPSESSENGICDMLECLSAFGGGDCDDV
jgi:hypothetical protein